MATRSMSERLQTLQSLLSMGLISILKLRQMYRMSCIQDVRLSISGYVFFNPCILTLIFLFSRHVCLWYDHLLIVGSFKDAKGNLEEWDLIASGTVTGRGIGRYTIIPPETFTSVVVPGGGGEEGTRAFYLTLNTNDLVYRMSTGVESDKVSHMSSPDLEIYEGEGGDYFCFIYHESHHCIPMQLIHLLVPLLLTIVLFYPMPAASETMFYRYPRQFLGTIRYDRLP